MNKLWAAMIVPVVGFFGAMANVYADSTLVTVNISNTSLELDVPASPTILTLNPTASGANFGYVDLTATVGTNNPTGYTLSVTFSDTSLTRTSAVGGTTPTISTLDTLAGGYPVADFTVNRWGHKITGDNYFPVPSSTLSPESWSSDEPVNNAPNVITLAAKADGTIPSGIYETTLTYTLVANPGIITFDDAFSAASKIKDTTTDKYKMQDIDAFICDAVTTKQTGELVDDRDGTVYRVGKLKDGRCWLLDNLALDLTDPTTLAVLSDTNTNASSTAIGYLRGTTTRDPSQDPDGNYATAGVTGWRNGYTNIAPLVNAESKNLTYASDVLDATKTSKYGIYYNYCAASAGSYCYGYNASIDRLNTLIDAEYDVCPSGWRMPTGSSYGEYQALYDAYNSDITSFRTALLIPLSGNYNNGSTYSQGSEGLFWSSTRILTGSMYYLRFDSSGINQSHDFTTRDVGNTMRCIAKTNDELNPTPVDPSQNTTFDEAYAAAGKSKDTVTGKYKMQDMTTSICNAVTAPIQEDSSDTQEALLVDNRDNKLYWVAKLKDGHCWMTQNLDLDLEAIATNVKPLTSENTDLNTFGSNGYDSNNGYNKDTNNVITWAPERDTIPVSSISTAGVISGWTDDYDNPYSVDVGDWYWIGNWKNNNTDTWYGSATNNYLDRDNSGAGDKFSTSPYVGNDKHGHVGNYYNWPATIASNDASFYTSNSYRGISGNPQNSICPAGWRLPTVADDYDTDGSTNEFRRIATLYGHTTNNDKVLTASPLWLIRAGRIYSGRLNHSGLYGEYWSSTVSNNETAYHLLFYYSTVGPAYSGGSRGNGQSVRCVAR